MSAVVRLRAALIASAVLACAGCVAPVASDGHYRQMAASSATAARSAARSAVLAVDTSQRGKLPRAALEVLLQESEAALGSIASTFGSIQPPDTADADALRDRLGTLLAEADDQSQDLRIAARRQDAASLTSGARALATTAADLESLLEELQ